MYLASKTDAHIEKALSQSKQALLAMSDILASAAREECVVSSQKSLYTKVPRDGSIYIVKEGTLKCIKNDKVLYYVEEGDLVGFEGSAFDPSMDYYAEFAVAVAKIDPSVFLQSDQSVKMWNSFQGSFLNAILQYVSLSAKSESNLSPEVRNYSAGDAIIRQGECTREVYSIIDGIAETIVDGNSVSEVLPDQFFGAVSLLSNTPSLASVVALTDCMVVVLSREQFVTLVESKPDTLLKLAEDLSRAIVALNSEVRGLVKIT